MALPTTSAAQLAAIQLANRRLRVKAAAATVLLTVPLVAAVALAGWRIVHLATGGRAGLAEGIAGIALLLALSTALGLRRLDQPPARLPLLPLRLQQLARQLAELSWYGSGSLQGWTSANPAVGLDRLTEPAPVDDEVAGADKAPSGGPAPRSGRADGQQPRGPATPEAPTGPAPERYEGPVEERVVRRGDTWWTLAEELLDDGGRWPAIRQLNLGRQVDSGHIIDDDTILRPGWRISVPAVAPASGEQ